MYSRKSNWVTEVTNSPINVPFSWENSPGVSKAARQVSATWQELPPPPVAAKCPKTPSPIAADQEIMYLQMCNLHVALKSPFNYKGRVVADREPGDPFLAAYVKCTASPLNYSKPEAAAAAQDGGKVRKRKNVFRVCCLESCSVVD